MSLSRTAMVFAFFLCVGCSGKPSDSDGDAGSASGCPGFPSTPAGAQLEWLVDTIAGNPAALVASDYEAHTTDTYRASMPLADFRAGLQTIAASGTLRLRGFARQAEAQVLGGVFSATDTTVWGLGVVVAGPPDGRIANLEVEQPKTSDLTASLDAMASGATTSVGFLIAEISGTTCTPDFAYGAGDRLALASVFKLYILGALANAIDLGVTSWDAQVPIESALFSTGVTAGETPGATVTVKELARRMIGNSDNTATDHLLFHVGRAAVEAFMGSMGHADPTVNTPFIGAREALTLKFVAPNLGTAYCATTDVASRRQVLAQSSAVPMDIGALPSETAPGSPTLVDCVEWFASPDELCSALATLIEMARQPGLAEIRDVLQPAAEVAELLDSSTWPVTGFKPGSEPGVSANAWVLQRCDGRWFSATAAFNDTATNLGQLPDVIGWSIPLILGAY